jgi:methanogenic corrinoid protein MtbC1
MVDDEREILNRLKTRLTELDLDGVVAACRDVLSTGISPYKAVKEGMADGMRMVGERYESKEYFLSELVIAGEIMKEGMAILEPHLRGGGDDAGSRVVLGSVQGDVHDIGKNIVATLLTAAGFEVFDLGTDVTAADFAAAVRRHRPAVVALSALLTSTMPEMGVVIDELRRARLRDQVKVLIGGASVTAEFADRIGADAAVRDAVEGVNLCRRWVGLA